MHILSDIPVALNARKLMEGLCIEPDAEDAEAFAVLLSQLQPHVQPKAIYAEAYVDERGDETVTLNGVTFQSRVLRKNLESVERVFPFVATCGTEADTVAEIPPSDMVQQFWLDTVKQELLRCSRRYLGEWLKKRYALGKTATMSPGSADAAVWPIEEQRKLFSLFGDVEAMIGVHLTDTCLMLPNKSVSGICFPTERDYRNCQLCTRESCPSRSAPFSPEMQAAYYGHGLCSDARER